MALVAGDAYALHTTPGAIEPGDKVSFDVPIENDITNDAFLTNVRLEVSNLPIWLKLLTTSFIGPIPSLPPGEKVHFRLNFEITPAFTPDQSQAEILAEIKSDATNLHAPRFVWHFRTTNGFLTFNAECLDEAGGSYGGAVSRDSRPPVTNPLFIGPTFTDQSGNLFIAAHTAVGLEGIDQIIEDAVTSEVAFTGFLVDQPATNISQLTPFVSTFTLSEGSHFIMFASSDNASNAETLKRRDLVVDGTAPAPPVNLLADGSNPSPWRSITAFTVTWQNPPEISGVKGSFFRLNGFPEVFVSTSQLLIQDFPGQLVNGSNLLFVRLKDNVENENPADAAAANLRFDDLRPGSVAVAPSTSSAAFQVALDASDSGAELVPPTGGGMDRTVLWFRRDHNGDGAFGDWARVSTFVAGPRTPDGTGPARSMGTILFDPVAFDPVSPDGAYQFYTQAFDVAGNLEPPPFPGVLAKAETFFDRTPPVIADVAVPAIGPSFAQVRWTTDDETRGAVEYGASTAFGLSVQTLLGRSHSAILDSSLPSPATVFFRITATNRPGLKTQDSVRLLATPLDIAVPTDIFGVIDLAEPIRINVTNPFLNFVGVEVQDGVFLSTSLALPGGVDLLRLQIDGLSLSALFPPGRLAAPPEMPFVVSAGGLITPFVPGVSSIEMTLGEMAVAASTEALTSGSSKMFLGFYSRIDPIAPGNVTDLSALSGPGQGQITLSWTAAGDDAGVGQAMKYDLRVAREPITPANFLRAVRIAQAPLPSAGGSTQKVILSGLQEATTYFFGLKAVDELLNASPIAALASTRTPLATETPGLPPPSVEIVQLPPDSLAPPAPPTLTVEVSSETILSGAQRLSIRLNGFVFESEFVVDIATRAVRLARLVVDAGGVMTSTETTASIADMTLGQAAQESMSSPQSRMFWGYYAGIDPVAPGAITDLSAKSGPGVGQVKLSWSAPGDDAGMGTAMKYDLRIATFGITDSNFLAVSSVSISTFPALGGTAQEAVVAGLSDATTFFFAMKALDELLNASPFGNVAGAKTFEVARSTDLTAGQPTVEFVSSVSGVSVARISTTTVNPAVALATSAAAAQGLVFASALYDIVSPAPSLPGGATIQFRYMDPGDIAVESSLRIYQFKPALNAWFLVADISPILGQDIFVVPVAALSLFAILAPDETPPATALEFLGGRRFVSFSGALFASTSTAYSLKARDPPLGLLPGLGVLRTEFRVDTATTGFTLLDPLNPLLQLPEGLHTIQFRSLDMGGNVEPIKSAAIGVDGAAPVVLLSALPGPFTLIRDGILIPSLPAELVVLVRDPLVVGGPLDSGSGVATVRFNVDGGSFTASGSSFTLTLPLGPHFLGIVAEDNIGNVLERSTNPFKIVVGDTEAPRILIESPQGGEKFTAFLSTLAVRFSVTDNFDPAPSSAAFLAQLEDRGTPRGLRPALVPVSHGQDLEPFGLDDGLWELQVSAADFAQNSTQAVSGLFEIVHDTMPPRTVLAIGTPQASGGPGGATFVTGRTPLNLTSIDDLLIVGDSLGLGVAFQQLSLDGVLRSSFTNFSPAPGQVFSSTFTLSADPEGIRVLSYFAEDILANRESVRVATVAVDNTAPLSSLAFVGGHRFVTPEKVFASTKTAYAVAAADPEVGGVASGVDFSEFSVDAAPFARFTSFFLNEGIRQVSFKSQDRVRNLEVAKSTTVHVDATPPISTAVLSGISFLTPPSDTQAVGGPLFITSYTLVGLRAQDPAVEGVASGLFTIFFDVDATPLKFFTTDFAVPQEGRREVRFLAQDNVKNEEPERVFRVSVDTTPPATELSFQGVSSLPQSGFISEAEVFISTDTTIVLTAKDPVSKEVASGVGVTKFRIDGGTFTAHSGPFRIANEGLRTLEWRSLDRVNNEERLNVRKIAVDRTPPESRLDIGAPKAALADGSTLVSGRTPFIVVSTDPVSSGVASGLKGSFVAIDTEAFLPSATFFTLAPPDGSRVIRFFGRDNVLNTEVAKSTTVILDATPPVALLLSPSPEARGMDQVFGKGIVPVVATVSELHFRSFLLESAPGKDATGGFATISFGTEAVSQGVIARWDTSALSGFLTLRLTATDLVENVAIATATVFIGDPTLLLTLENAPDGKGLLKKPEGVAVDFQGNIYVANTGQDQVLKFSATGQLLLSFDGLFNKPMGLALDQAGNLFVADRNNNRIAVLSSTGAVIRSVGRTNPEGRFIPGKGPGEFNKPTGVAVSTGRIVVADRNNERLQVFDAAFSFLFEIRIAELAPALPEPADEDDEEDGETDETEESKPFGVALDPAGNIYVTDEENGRILAFDPQGKFLFSLGREGELVGQFENPKAIASSALKYLYAADRGNKRVQKIDPFQNPVLAFGAAFGLRQPVAMALDGSVNLYVTDRNMDKVLKFGLPDGTLVVSLPPVSKVKKGRIGSPGGKVERDDNVKVEVPEGALKQEVEITVEPERPRPSEELARKADKLKEKKLAAVSEAVEYGPEGTQFEKAVAITLAYDPDKLSQGVGEDDLKVYHWNPRTGDWEKQYSVVNKASHTVSALVGHFSLYQVMALAPGVGTAALPLAADPSFGLKAAYVFPNPVRGQNSVTIRIQPGIADSVTVRVYDVAGRRVHESSNFTDRGAFDDSNGLGAQFTYDHIWDVSGVGSGVYTYVVVAHKAGQADIHKTGRVGVVK